MCVCASWRYVSIRWSITAKLPVAHRPYLAFREVACQVACQAFRVAPCPSDSQFPMKGETKTTQGLNKPQTIFWGVGRSIDFGQRRFFFFSSTLCKHLEMGQDLVENESQAPESDFFNSTNSNKLGDRDQPLFSRIAWRKDPFYCGGCCHHFWCPSRKFQKRSRVLDLLWMEEILHQLIDRWFIPSSMGFQPSKVVQNFFISSIHRIYLPKVVLGELPMPSAENVHWPTRLPGRHARGSCWEARWHSRPRARCPANLLVTRDLTWFNHQKKGFNTIKHRNWTRKHNRFTYRKWGHSYPTWWSDIAIKNGGFTLKSLDLKPT